MIEVPGDCCGTRGKKPRPTKVIVTGGAAAAQRSAERLRPVYSVRVFRRQMSVDGAVLILWCAVIREKSKRQASGGAAGS